MENQLVYLAALLYSLITGLSFMFTKISLRTVSPIDVLAYRFTASFIVVLLLLAFNRIKLNYSWERVKRIIPLALLYPLLFFTFQTFGLQYATSSEGGILQAASPILTLILASYILKEKTNIYQRLSIILSVVGVLYIMVMKGSTLDVENIKGIFLLSMAPLSLSGYNVLARILTQDFTSMELSVVMVIISFLAFTTLATAGHIMAGTLGSILLPLKDPDFILSVIYLGVLSTLVSSLLTNFILSKIEASKMSVFANLGTVITIVAGVVFLKEKVAYYHIIGSILIVGGVLGTNFLDSEKIKMRQEAKRPDHSRPKQEGDKDL